MSDSPPIAALPSEVREAFTSSIITAIQELMQLDVQPVHPPESFATAPGGCLVATMRLARPRPGTMSLTLPAHVARRLAEAYLPQGTEMTEEIIGDVAGELANVIAGQAKTILKDTPYHFKLSLPDVAPAARCEKPRGTGLAFALMSQFVILHIDLGDPL
jgi:CheY-specific phosphatase CheX